MPLALVQIFAEDPTGTTGLDFSGVISALQGALTAQQLITYLSGIISVGITIYVAYVLVRKALGIFSNVIAGRKGRV